MLRRRRSMRVAVLGAGASGLVSGKLLAEAGIQYDIYEGTDKLGGNWTYSESYVDRHGLPTPSSMYKSLRTNLPKELMLFDGLDYDLDGISFIAAEHVLDYLEKFSSKYNLGPNIKFEHRVRQISRSLDDSWELVITDLQTHQESTHNYDAVFICNGHYSEPSYVEICGAGSFPGPAQHSHYYRLPHTYQDKVVLITGIGPSAVDITLELSSYAKKIYLSHHGPDFLQNMFPENVLHKPDVKWIDGSTIHFLDGSAELVEAIIYCSGYKYCYPFLNESCGITVEDNYVQPLYKQMISIPHTSMFFIGLPHRSFLFQLFQLQARCCIRLLTGEAVLPEKEEMSAETRSWEERLALRGVPKRKYHCILEYVQEYFDEIALLARLPPLPRVLFSIFSSCNTIRREQLATYRSSVFRVVDSNTFTLVDSAT